MTSMPPGYPWTRFSHIRVRSRLAAAVDVVAMVVGAALTVVVGMNSLLSWPSDRVWLDHGTVDRNALIALFPCWCWLLLSYATVFGVSLRKRDWPVDRNRTAAESRRDLWPDRRVRWGMGAAALLCLALVGGAYVVGTAKGEGRVRPGPVYEVSVSPLNDWAWTAVSADEYRHWQTQFIRRDTGLVLFGLALFGGSLGMRSLHRRARRTPPVAAPTA